MQLAGVVLAVFGPTGAGKTAVAEALARRLPAEIVSADAMQVYRGLPLLTNQSPHPAHLVAVWDVERAGSVAEYQRLAHAAIDDMLARGRVPIVAGGTGLYLRAALSDLALPPAPTAGARERWGRVYDERGSVAAHALLAERDPRAAAAVHPNDRRRVIRALELADAGRSLAPAREMLWTDETRHPTLVFGLEVPKAELDRRIEERARRMFAAGVEDEVQRALARGVSHTAAKVLGLRELAELPREEALVALTRRTRSYASYQRKWMRRIPGLVSVRADRPADEVADEILEVARAREPVSARRRR